MPDPALQELKRQEVEREEMRTALYWIRGFASGLEERHTGFRHIRHRAETALGIGSAQQDSEVQTGTAKERSA